MSNSWIEIYALICNKYLGLFLQSLIKRKSQKRQPKIKQNIRGIFLTITFSPRLTKFLSDFLLNFSACLLLLIYNATGGKRFRFLVLSFLLNELISEIIKYFFMHLFCNIRFWDKIKLAKNKELFYVKILSVFAWEIYFNEMNTNLWEVW